MVTDPITQSMFLRIAKGTDRGQQGIRGFQIV